MKRGPVEDFLQSINPEPTKASASARPLRSPRRSLVLGAVIATSVAAIVLSLRVDDQSLRAFTPAEAAAATRASLSGPGVLEWTQIQNAGTTRTTLWVDLKSGHTKEVQADGGQDASGQPSGAATIWQHGRDTYVDEGVRGSDGRKVILHRVGRGGRADTPVDQVRQMLDRAEEGVAIARDAGFIGGVPAVAISEESDNRTSTVWIAKTQPPRLLRARYTTTCSTPNLICSKRSQGGQGGVATETETITWTVHPPSSDALAEVQTPRWDAEKFHVVEDK